MYDATYYWHKNWQTVQRIVENAFIHLNVLSDSSWIVYLFLSLFFCLQSSILFIRWTVSFDYENVEIAITSRSTGSSLWTTQNESVDIFFPRLIYPTYIINDWRAMDLRWIGISLDSLSLRCLQAHLEDTRLINNVLKWIMYEMSNVGAFPFFSVKIDTYYTYTHTHSGFYKRHTKPLYIKYTLPPDSR